MQDDFDLDMDFLKTKKKKKKKKDLDELVAEDTEKKGDKSDDSKSFWFLRFSVQCKVDYLFTFLFKCTCFNDGQWNFESGKGFN